MKNFIFHLRGSASLERFSFAGKVQLRWKGLACLGGCLPECFFIDGGLIYE